MRRGWPAAVLPLLLLGAFAPRLAACTRPLIDLDLGDAVLEQGAAAGGEGLAQAGGSDADWWTASKEARTEEAALMHAAAVANVQAQLDALDEAHSKEAGSVRASMAGSLEADLPLIHNTHHATTQQQQQDAEDGDTDAVSAYGGAVTTAHSEQHTKPASDSSRLFEDDFLEGGSEHSEEADAADDVDVDAEEEEEEEEQQMADVRSVLPGFGGDEDDEVALGDNDDGDDATADGWGDDDQEEEKAEDGDDDELGSTGFGHAQQDDEDEDGWGTAGWLDEDEEEGPAGRADHDNIDDDDDDFFGADRPRLPGRRRRLHSSEQDGRLLSLLVNRLVDGGSGSDSADALGSDPSGSKGFSSIGGGEAAAGEEEAVLLEEDEAEAASSFMDGSGGFSSIGGSLEEAEAASGGGSWPYLEEEESLIDPSFAANTL